MSYVAEQIRAVIGIDPAPVALRAKQGERTWGDVKRLVDDLGRMLDGLGLGPATPIGVMLRTRPDHVAAICGVLAGERCLVTLNPVLPDAKLAADIAKLHVPVIIGDSEDWSRAPVRDAAAASGGVGILLTGDPKAPLRFIDGLDKLGAGPFMPAQPGVGVLLLTSGTTGEPKRAPLGYKQLEAQLKRSARGDRSRTEDAPPTLREGISIHHAPLVHISGLWGVLTAMTAGGALHLIEKFNVPEWRDAIVRYRPLGAGGPPTALRMIYDANLPKEDLASLKTLGTGTAGIDPNLVDAFMERYGLPVLATYGATEFAGGVAGWSLPSFQKYWKTKRGAAGRMNPGCEGRTVDPATGEPLAIGEPGVLELRANTVGDGQTWTRTSDLARLDEDHFIWILGRVDNAIVRGGFKVHPDEVVKALQAHPSVKEASVVGIADARLGAAPVAALVLREGAPRPSDEELVARVREDLAAYNVPVAFKIVDELPRTPSMKVSTPAVRALFETAPSS